MHKTISKYVLPLALGTLLLSGCVATGQINERRGTKAFLERDYATAVEKYTQASAEGNAKAQYYLAVMYAEGQGVEQDYAKAAELLQLAADQGLVDAQLMLGLFYVYGDGVEMNPAKGAPLLRKAADQNNDVAMYYLGHLYAAGLGVPKDISKALIWLQRAKDAGFPVKDEMLNATGLSSMYKE